MLLSCQTVSNIALLGAPSPLQLGGGPSVLDLLFSVHALELLGGIVLLYLGAELLVAGASRLSLGLGMHAAIVGVTVVAFGTTTPELFVAALGGLGYSSQLGLGTIVGSNIANIGLVLGLAALIRPMSIDKQVLYKHLPFMFLAAILLVGLGRDGMIGRGDALVFLGLLAAFTVVLYRNAKYDPSTLDTDEVDLDVDTDLDLRDVGKFVVGIVLLFLGSRWLIQGGQTMLVSVGFDERLVGLTILAFGTSLPELAASVISAVRDESDLSIGNVVGSNIYNILAVLGVVALMVPLSVPESMVSFDFPMLVFFTVGAILLMFHNNNVTRFDGGVLVGGYIVFVYFLL